MRLIKPAFIIILFIFLLFDTSMAEKFKVLADKAIEENNVKFAIENIKKATNERLKNFSYNGNTWGNFLRSHGKEELAYNYAKQLFDQEQKDGKLSYWDWKPLVTAIIVKQNYVELENLFEIVFRKDSPSRGVEYAHFFIDTFNDHKSAEKILKNCVDLAQKNKKLTPYQKLATFKNLANYYEDYGKSKEQEHVLMNIENKFSRDKDAKLYTIKKYASLKQFSKAKEIFSNLNGNLKDKKTIKAFAKILSENGEVSQAIDILNQEIRKSNKDKDKLDLLVKLLSISLNYSNDLSIQYFENYLNYALKLNPKRWDAVYLLEIIRDIGKEDPSVKSFIEIGRKLYKNDCWNTCYSNYAEYLSNIGEYKSAFAILLEGESELSNQNYKKQMWKQSLKLAAEIRLLNKFERIARKVQEYPEYESYFEIGRLNEIFFDRFSTASKYYDKAYEIAPNDKKKNESIFAIARVKTKSGDLKGAEKFIVDYFKNNTSTEDSYKYLSYFYRVYLKDRDKALRILFEELKKGKDLSKKVDIMRRMAKAYLIRIDPKPQKAIALYEKALILSDLTQLYADLCLTYNNYTNNTSKKDYYENILLKRKPNNYLYRSWYATTLAQRGRRKEAFKIMNSIPANKRYKYSLACVHANLGDTEKALGYLELSFQKNYSNKGKNKRNEQRLHIIADNDLQSLKYTKRFQLLTALEK